MSVTILLIIDASSAVLHPPSSRVLMIFTTVLMIFTTVLMIFMSGCDRLGWGRGFPRFSLFRTWQLWLGEGGMAYSPPLPYSYIHCCGMHNASCLVPNQCTAIAYLNNPSSLSSTSLALIVGRVFYKEN